MPTARFDRAGVNAAVRTPEQLRRIKTLCRLVEMATVVELTT